MSLYSSSHLIFQSINKLLFLDNCMIVDEQMNAAINHPGLIPKTGRNPTEINQVNWQQASIIIEYKKNIPERRSLPEVRMGQGLAQKICVQRLENNVSFCKIATNQGISSFTLHNVIKRFRESGEISVLKGQGQKLIL